MTTGWWRRAVMLKKLLSLVGGLIAAPLGAGCTKADLEGRTFQADIPMTEEQIQELTGKPSLVGTKGMEFEDTLTFTRIDETIDVTGYKLVDTGENGVHVGKFTTRATLRKGYTGGPPGSATEFFVEVDDKSRLVGELSLPKAPPGTRAIFPGQNVVRRIQEGELARLDDRYVIELPAGRIVQLHFTPWKGYFSPEADYDFGLSLTKNGKALRVHDRGKGYYSFETTEAGLHEFRVRAKGRAAQEPDRYCFYMFWGTGVRMSGSYLHLVNLRTIPAAELSATPATKR
jgi:hypothetical protein